MLSPLEVPQDRVGDGGEAEGDLETDVAAEGTRQHASDGAHVPRLAHRGHGSGYTAARCESSGPSDGQVVVLVVPLEVVVLERSLAEDVVLLQQDARVDGEPVYAWGRLSALESTRADIGKLTGEDDEEGVKGRLEAVVAGFGENNVYIAQAGCQHE